MAQVPEYTLFRSAPQASPRSPAGCQSAGRGESGQALVETALVMPLMIFLILGIIQLALLQHAKIMSEYAAFNAARAGIVWNADPFTMENAAIISLLPVQEGLLKDGDMLNPMALVKRVVQRALVYQTNRRMSQAVGWLNRSTGGALNPFGRPTRGSAGGADPYSQTRANLSNAASTGGAMAQNIAEGAAVAAIGGLLGGLDDRMVRVTVVNPNFGVIAHQIQGMVTGQAPGLDRTTNLALNNLSTMATSAEQMQNMPLGEPGSNALLGRGGVAGAMGEMLVGHFPAGVRELEFDDFYPAGTLLTIRLRYMYVMRIPFANWVIHGAWMAGIAFQRLYGAIWNPQLVRSSGLGSPAPFRGGRARVVPFTYGFEQRDVDVSAKLAEGGEYAIPIYASHSMRMQSNVYRTNILMSQ